jgi:hypothetical protein
VHIRAGADPHSLQAGMLDHLVVGIVDLDPPVFVFVLGPLELGRFTAAYGSYASVRYAVEEGTDVTLAHAAEACYGDGDLDILFTGHCEVLAFMD